MPDAAKAQGDLKCPKCRNAAIAYDAGPSLFIITLFLQVVFIIHPPTPIPRPFAFKRSFSLQRDETPHGG